MTTTPGEPGWIGAELADHAAARPGADAIVAADGAILSWADFHRMVLATAGYLHARGLEPGMTAALVIRDRPQDLAAIFALLRLGVALLGLDPAEPAEMNAELVGRSGARFLIGEAGDAVPAVGTAGGVAWAALADVAAAPPLERPLPPPPDPDAVAFVARSSGTTGGVAKLTPASHRLLLRRGRGMLAAFPRGPGDRYLSLVRLAFAFGRNGALRALQCGGAVILPPPLQRPDDLAALARARGATWTAMTPAHLRELARAETAEPLLGAMRILASTAALSVAERRLVRARVSPNLIVGYGSNEVGTLTMAMGEDHEARPGTVGRLLPGVAGEAVGEDGRPLPPGETGELRFRSPDFPAAYFDAVPGQASRFADGWYYPGDVGAIDAEGYFFLRGRSDDVINVGGVKVYPADIEAALAAHPAVAEAAVVALPAGRSGAAPAAAVVLTAPASAADLHRHVVERLGAGRAPRRILVLPALPRTALDKVDRAALVRLLAAGDPGGRAPG
ncbi:hypothetical protein STAQ_40360 [Allostella sp. ATCC 35155]|nr:hypothetical protein STAQ_40360 [Stella sp. ATCC 35155]